MTVQQYCLRWNNHQPNFISVFSSLLSNQSLVDVTLAAEGKHLQAHKVVLSACSSYFQSLFTINPCKHPIVILKDVKFLDLKVMVDFMYHGEVNVSQEQLPCILKTAEMLKIKGLTEIPVDQSATRPTEKCELTPNPEENWTYNENVRITSPSSPTGRRKRLKKNICSSGNDSENPSTSNEILLGTVENLNVIGTILKSDNDRYNPPDNTHHSHHQQNQQPTPQKCNGLTVPIVQQPGPSHEVTEPDPTHHVSLQVTPHDLNPPQTVDCSPLEIPRITTTQQATTASPPPKPVSPPPQEHIGTKRGRFLMRQSRIKRESDPPPESGDSDVGPKPSSSYLAVPPVRIERQCSDPLPSSASPTSENLLSISEHILMKQHSHPLLPTKPVETNNPRSSHCPAVRSGPALGCNYCWNTVDTHGRILRRKTKYHCPECQTNLCIVPCFQEYHKCQEGNNSSSSSSISTPQQSSSLMLTSTVKMFPKTN